VCRNIKTLFNFEPPATQDEIQAAALQFVRKVSGTTKPSVANEEVFTEAVADITGIVEELLSRLTTQAAPKDRAVELAKARERNSRRFPAVAP